MYRSRKWPNRLLFVAVLSALWAGSSYLIAEPPAPVSTLEFSAPQPPEPPVPEKPAIQLVQGEGTAAPPQQPAPPTQPITPTPGTAGTGGGYGAIPGLVPSAGGGPSQFSPPSAQGLPTRAEASTMTGPSGPGLEVVSGGVTAQAVNATDVSQLFTNTTTTTGVEFQQRNPVMNDPRVRGYKVPDLVTWGNYGYFLPARLDLDTAVGKFNPRSVRDVIVIKGPYSVRLGPGLAFLDISTFDSPRYQEGFDWDGMTSLNYQTNGQRFNVYQMLQGGDADWGVRAVYDFQDGNSYRAGNGQVVPSGYNSQNVNGGFGFNLTENQKLEFKVMRLYQHDVQFAGLYFDLSRLDTESYSMRYTIKDQPFFNLLRLDLWDNYTKAFGDTTRADKQAALNNVILPSIFQKQPGQITDHGSVSNFNEGSRGYRLAVTWGDQNRAQLTVGSDLNYVRQALAENIILQQQVSSTFPPLGTGPDGLLTQNLAIPTSHFVDPGLFLDASVPFTDRLTLTGGLRGDSMYTNSTPTLINGNTIIAPGAQSAALIPGQIPPPSITPTTSVNPLIFSTRYWDPNMARHFTTWAAFAALNYKIDQHWTSFAKFGYAQRPPTLTELYAAGPFIAVLQQGLNRLIGDPHLNAERAKQVDIGITGTYDRLQIGANGFYSWIGDYITYDLNNAAAGQLSQVVYTNTPLATLAGGELFGQVNLTRWLTPFVNVTYVQGRDLTHNDDLRAANLVSSRRTGATEPLPGIPPLEVRSGVRLHEASKQPKWAVELTVRSVAAQNLVATSLNEVQTGSFNVVYLRTYWQATDKLLLTAGVENLGDKFYREHLDPLAGGQLFRPGTNIYFGAQLRY